MYTGMLTSSNHSQTTHHDFMRSEYPNNSELAVITHTRNARLKNTRPMRMSARRVNARFNIPIDRGKKSIYIKVRLEDWYIERIKDTAS